MAAGRRPPPTEEACSSWFLRTLNSCMAACVNSVKLFLQHGNFLVATALKSPSPSHYDLLMDPQEWLIMRENNPTPVKI